uniref:Peptidase aspartic putative domain-containing protein n=1 Tax=Cacopsylla melanoneura TaxID=428564 RepID=A0A8D9EA95_9HEMI
MCNDIVRNSKHHTVVQSNTSATVQSNVLMQTLVVCVHGKQGKKYARLLFDSGSQRSYVKNKTAREMGFEPTRTEKLQHALFGGQLTDTAEYNVFSIQFAYLRFR